MGRLVALLYGVVAYLADQDARGVIELYAARPEHAPKRAASPARRP